MNWRAADLSPRHARHAGIRREADRAPRTRSSRRTAARCAPAGFTDRDIWDIAAVAAFFNMSNRMASAIDMRPNAEYHAMAR